MRLSQFKYRLPEDRIAQEPVFHRDESKLMVVHRGTGDIEHCQFKDILNQFDDFFFKDINLLDKGVVQR